MAKAQRKKSKVKTKTVRFYGVNITLQSKERKGDTVYLDLIKKIYEDQMVMNIGGEKMMAMRTQFSKKIDFNNQSYSILYGKLLRFTVVKNWYNKKEDIFQDYKTPEDIVPNAFETEFTFIPEAHRFFIKYNNKINIFQVQTFLIKALRELIVTDEIINVNIIQSKDVIDKIIESKGISRLLVNVSYTNDDINKEAQELIDKMLKEANAGQVEVVIKPDATGTLEAKSNLVNGFLGLAKDNGTATATIVSSNGKKEIISTEDKPEKIYITVTESDGYREEENEVLFNKIMTEHRQKK